MDLDRRQLLLGALTMAASARTLLGDVSQTQQFHSRSRASRWERMIDTPLLDARFPGDPGDGRLYYGAAVMASLSIDDLEAAIGGILTVRRSYYLADGVSGLIARVREDHDAGRFPLVSTKLPGTWADVAQGKYDSWLGDLLQRLDAERFPVMLSLHHEPEDDIGPDGMSAGSWQDMQRHAIDLAAELTDNTTIVPILMQWTFDPRSGRDPHEWICDEAPLFGLDLYNQWFYGGGIPWVSFEDKLATVRKLVPDKPIMVGEYGCRSDPDQPGRAAGWMLDAYRVAAQSNVVGLSYYDSNLHSPNGSWVLDQERTEAMARCRQRDATAWLPNAIAG